MRSRLSSLRCPRCEIRKPLCFCAWIPRIPLATRVVVLMHTFEKFLTTNTAKLATKALVNSEIYIHGKKDERIPHELLYQPDRIPLLLYPSSHATVLTPEFVKTLSKPVTLIVPDANWRQTKKFVRREPILQGIPLVRIPEGPPSEYQLRMQRHESGVCTLEAIARAIGQLESSEAQLQLERLLRVMVERRLWSRGRLAADGCVTSGIPRDAFSGSRSLGSDEGKSTGVE